MKIGSKLQYEVPDKCPEDCKHIKTECKAVNGLCALCPVCLYSTGMGTVIVPPEQFRDDFAKAWVEFFDTGDEAGINAVWDLIKHAASCPCTDCPEDQLWDCSPDTCDRLNKEVSDE